MKKSSKLQKTSDEFKSFIKRGNILDMATGIIIGAAFSSIVNSLVNDIIMPLISNFINFDLTNAKIELKPQIVDSEGNVLKKAITLNYGNFFQYIINFMIIALSIFFAIKIIKSIHNNYIKSQIRYVKKLKKTHPTWFDEETDLGTKTYEKLKKEHPEFFKNEMAEEIEVKKQQAENKKDPVVTNNELLKRLNDNLEKLISKSENDENREEAA